jgi:hypothetical protein
MGLLQPNPTIGTLHGTVGDLVFARTQDGQVQVRHRPVRRVDFKPGELANQSQFKLAAAYVKRVRAQPELYAVYEQAALIARKRACNLAHADLRHPPVIEDIDLSAYAGLPGQIIRVRAVDDFGVERIAVVISALDGAVLEQGDASPAENATVWVYAAQAAVPVGQTVVVKVTATDRPGNKVTKTFDHALQ